MKKPFLIVTALAAALNIIVTLSFAGNAEAPAAANSIGMKLAHIPPGELVMAARPRKPGDVVANSIGMKLAYIPAGEFVMGSPETEAGREDAVTSETQHRVKLTKAFRMGTTEVTQAQWRAVMGDNPSKFKGDNLPVDNVSWDNAVAFCRKLSAKEHRHYRLPTEAEWEYACRAGTTTAYYTGENTTALGKAGWSKDNSNKSTHPVGTKKANAWGLYDMHGNVWEWCSDWHGESQSKMVSDPTGPANGTFRVIRGGSWYSPPERCRAACSEYNAPFGGGNIFGLRLVLESE